VVTTGQDTETAIATCERLAEQIDILVEVASE
jgi:hypothetical protein